MVHGDIIRLKTADNQLALREIQNTFNLSARIEDDTICLDVEKGDEFIPKMIHALTVQTLSVRLQKPTLNDVFLKLTGRTIRDEALVDDKETTREFVRSHRRAQR